MAARPTTAIAVAAALAVGAGGGYAGAAANEPAQAGTPQAQGSAPGDSMMGGRDGSMMAKMMDAEHAKMMRDPAMRDMHRSMREHMQG